MGSFYSSIHIQSKELAAVLKAARNLAERAQGAFYVAAPKNGWVAVYPPGNLAPDTLARDLAKDVGSTHAIAFSLHDSDVLQYWFYKNGRLADSFNSMPDYFGRAKKADMNAVGSAAAFAGLLDAAAQKRWAQLVRGRMINGKEIGTLPESEDDRLAELGSLLGIHGVLGAFEYLQQGEPLPDGRKAKNMALVGELPAEEPIDESPAPRYTTMSLTGSGDEMRLVSLGDPEGKPMTVEELMALARKRLPKGRSPKPPKNRNSVTGPKKPSSTQKKVTAKPQSAKKKARKRS